MPRKKTTKPDAAPPPAPGKPVAQPAPDGQAAPLGAAVPQQPKGRPSPLVDTRVIYCGDNLEQLRKLPDGCILTNRGTMRESRRLVRAEKP
jgi:hypothetical protein